MNKIFPSTMSLVCGARSIFLSLFFYFISRRAGSVRTKGGDGRGGGKWSIVSDKCSSNSNAAQLRTNARRRREWMGKKKIKGSL